MLASFDLESRGLFGSIFKLGYYDGSDYYECDHGPALVTHLLAQVEKHGKIDLFTFNLEFDLSKLLNSLIEYGDQDLLAKFELDWSKSLIINGRFHVAKLKNYEIYLRDIYPLVNCSLEQASTSFELANSKIIPELGGLTKEQWFLTVAPNDEKLCEYLKLDVLSTYELVYKLMGLSGLEEKDFLRCPTLASLAMKIYSTQFRKDFEQVKGSELYKTCEQFVRQAYYGGRTEIFKPVMNQGYHYDVNSLYPQVMEVNSYPVGPPSKLREELPAAEKMTIFEMVRKRKLPYLLHAKLKVKEVYIPTIPKRYEDKLVFPTGVFTTYVPNPELEYALHRGEVEVLEVIGMVWWKKTAPIFREFVEKFKSLKLGSIGAKRNFAKLIQNSLYGKFGMQRERLTYVEFDQKKYENFREKQILCAKLRTPFRRGDDWKHILSYRKLFFADYIRPHYAALITSYARVALIRQIHNLEAQGASVYYCDTDSIFTSQPLPAEEVDDKVYGKWKLEHEVAEAVFVLPKLYAFVDQSGEVIMKNKGIVRPYVKTLSFASYLQFYQNLISKNDHTLYDEHAGYVGRENIMQALRLSKPLERKLRLRKVLRFSLVILKRQYDFVNNSSLPLVLQE